MRLDRMKLGGFKSFVDPTLVRFPSNLIGIVGPNGCGKSNVIDAVRWVMGESSAKNLRGEAMADVIFNGSSSRRPVGHASIELVFDNGDGSLGGPYAQYAEISIRRQLSRDGQSAYYLNGARCRRRDIADIFLGTGLGPRSYAIIEQGMISRLIEAKPDELRIFLEEAAGISRYKERRRETEGRIAHARDNIARLNDQREEATRLLDHLQRQARLAERFRKLKGEERRCKGELLALRWRSLDQQAGARRLDVEEGENRLAAAAARQRAAEVEVERSRLAYAEAQDAFRVVQGRYYGIGAEVARLEQAIAHARDLRLRQQEELEQVERGCRESLAHRESDEQRAAELGAGLETDEPLLEALRQADVEAAAVLGAAEEGMHDWQGRWADFSDHMAEPARAAEVERTRIVHLEQVIEGLQHRLVRVREEQVRLGVHADLSQELERLLEQEGELLLAQRVSQQELEQAAARIAELRAGVRERFEVLEASRRQLHQLRGRRASLETLQQAALGKGSEGASAWLRKRGLEGCPRLAEQIEVEPRWQLALETVLGDHLRSACVREVHGLLHECEEFDQGVVRLFEAQAPAASGRQEGELALAAKVRSPWPLDSLLGGIYAAADLPEALGLRERLGRGESAVTPEGVWVGANWVRFGRERDRRDGMLERERELRELEKEIARLSAEVDAHIEALERARRLLAESEDGREATQAGSNEIGHQLAEVRGRMGDRRARIDQAARRLEHLRQEALELEQQVVLGEEDIARARVRLEEALAATQALEQDRERLLRERDELRRQLDEARQRVREGRQRTEDLAVRVEAMRSGRRAALEGLERLGGQMRLLEERAACLRQELETGRTPLEQLQRELEVRLSSHLVVEEELGQARAQVAAVEAQLREREQQRSAEERSEREHQRRVDELRLAETEIRVRAQTLQEQIEESDLRREELLASLSADAEPEIWQQKVEDLGRRIQRLGPINLAAIEECGQQQERVRYLESQHADLTEALATLESAIRKIDGETRNRFRDTYERVNGGLKEIFPRLFGGGDAFLEMTGDDLLSTGIAVMARPPGKRNSSIHQLSGGEKALTAVALVFSLFLLNPSPFCMLDEVDAPLDDANVARFTDLLREMSDRIQFIFVTHNKTSMQVADHLTGVTMSEPGVSRLVAVDVEEAVRMAAM